MEAIMQLVVDPSDGLHALYGEEIDLIAIGSITVRRASWVEPRKRA